MKTEPNRWGPLVLAVGVSVALVLSALAMLLNGCAAPEPITVELEDAGHLEPLGPAPVECLTLPPEMQGCGSCHVDRRDVAGWYLRPTTFPAQTFFSSPGLSSDTWGRWAFFVLFTQSNSATVPMHREPYGWAERCFCLNGDIGTTEQRCRTHAGEF